jgi:hypothetical protein
MQTNSLWSSEAGFERAGLESVVRPMDQLDIESPAFNSATQRPWLFRVVGRSSTPDVEQRLWIIYLAHRSNSRSDDIDFVENRQLYRHARQWLEAPGGHHARFRCFKKDR